MPPVRGAGSYSDDEARMSNTWSHCALSTVEKDALVEVISSVR